MTTTTAPAPATTTDTLRRVRYITNIDRIEGLTPAERRALGPVAGKYTFRLNDYYLDLIDWSDPDDPIRQLVIPRGEELDDYGALDASDEDANTVARGVQHKYADTALLLCNEVCGAYCRYCFRKRLFMAENDEANNDVSEGLDYIREHPGISNVLLTGGDPLLMSTRRIAASCASARGLERRRRHRRQPVSADTRHQRPARGTGRAVEPAVLCRLPALLPVPGTADRRERTLRDPHRRRLAHLPAGARPRVRAGAARALRHVARERQGRDPRRRPLEHLPALPPGEEPGRPGRFLVAERDDDAGWLDELSIHDWTRASLTRESATAAPPWQQPRPLLAAGSPLQLNDLGHKVSAEIRADEWAAEIAPSLTERSAAEPPYKVDALCEHYVEQFLHQQMRDRVDEAAYEHGIERAGVLAVLRVVLRNRLLADRQENPDAATAPSRERTTDGADSTVRKTA